MSSDMKSSTIVFLQSDGEDEDSNDQASNIESE